MEAFEVPTSKFVVSKPRQSIYNYFSLIMSDHVQLTLECLRRLNMESLKGKWGLRRLTVNSNTPGQDMKSSTTLLWLGHFLQNLVWPQKWYFTPELKLQIQISHPNSFLDMLWFPQYQKKFQPMKRTIFPKCCKPWMCYWLNPYVLGPRNPFSSLKIFI